MSRNVQQVIKEAERLLSSHHYDAAHDLAHHRSVYAKALDISQHITEPVDTDLLHIACMWHDIVIDKKDADKHKEVTQETAEHVRKYMLKQGFSERDAESVYLAVKHHEFGDKPVNTEGKILFDADKLDTLNLERIRRFVASDRMGQIPAWKLRAYIKGGTSMVKLTRRKLHYAYSKQLFDKAVNELWDDPEVAHYAEKYGVDLDDIKRSLRRTTLLDRLLAVIKR
mgnify:CR=1 FL=1